MASLHYERCLPYPPDAVFDLVADVERYPEFLPGWRSARVINRDNNTLTVEQSLGGRGFDWRFRTTATLERPRNIRIETRERPFRFLRQVWHFEPAADGGTVLSLEAEYELRGLPLRHLVSLVFDEGFRRTVRAFEQRAHDQLG